MRKRGFHYKMYATFGISLMLISVFSASFVSLNTFSTNAKADPPAGYNHRPIDEFFTSLACPPCVNGADPAQDGAWDDWGHDPAVRYNWVVFHTYAPSGDNLSTSEAAARQVDYNNGNPLYSNPTVIYDGGYIEGNTNDAEQVKEYIDTCGTRDVIRDVEVYIEQEFTAGGIQFHYQIHYLGGEGVIPDGTPSIDDLDASIYIFVVEDNVTDWSIVIDEYYLCHNVFREYALEDEQIRLVEDEWYNNSVTWDWPSPEPTVPIQPHLVKGIIGVFDTEDTSSGETAIYMPRLSNSANYISTIWDWEEDVPTISNVQVSNSLISADLSDPDGISSAWLVSNITGSAYNWSVVEMDVDEGHASAVFTELEGSTVNYTVLAYDNNHLGSQMPFEQHFIPKIDPAKITDLAAAQGSAEGEVELNWTAPGDDNNEGTASKYYIKYASSNIISETEWDSAINITNTPSPQPAGSPESFVVEDLTPGQTFYFAIRAEDESENLALISNSASATVPVDPGDTTAPAKITDLAAESGEIEGEVHLTWTAPGDDGNEGMASSYIIKRSTSIINSENSWDSSTDVDGEPQPKTAGSSEEFTVTGLDYDTEYYFAIRAVDDALNEGQISNSPGAYPAEPDTTRPEKIDDLAASPGSEAGSITLTWTAPGDDGNSGGKASTYIIRHSPSDITSESDWNSAIDVSGEPNPGNPGTTESFTVAGLTPDTGYYFAIRTEDEVPNLSDVSNTAYAIAPDTQLEPPEISNVYHDPTNPTSSDEITIYATVTGDVKTVRLSICKINESCSSYVMESVGVGGTLYKATLDPLSEGDYEYKIIASDSQDVTYDSDEYYFTVVKTTHANDGDGVSDDDDTPWYEKEGGIYMIMLLVLAIVICSVIATAFAMSKKKRQKEHIPAAEEVQTLEQEPIAEPIFTAYTPIQPQSEDISCPGCLTVFSIPLEPRPMQVQCPSCAMKGIID